MLHELPKLIDSKITSHHQSLTRLVDETIDDFIGEVTNYMDERAPASAAAALGPPFQYGPQAPSGLTRSFALAARAPPADATRMRSPISRTPAVPASIIHSDADINSKRAAFALNHHQSAMQVLENCGVQALLANSHLLSAADISEELTSRIAEISASENIKMPGPAATSNLDGNGTFREHKKGKLVHQAQPAAADHVKPGTGPAAANKWTKGTAPSTQYGPPGTNPRPSDPLP